MITFLGIIVWIAYLLGLYLIIFWLLVFLEEEISIAPKKIKRYPFVSIGIPAWNEEKRIQQTVDSVLQIDYPKNKYEVVIVNDCSIDKTEEIVRQIIKERSKSGYNIKLINHKENLRKGAALNTAIKHSKGEFFVCLDADSLVTRSALKKILPYFEDDPKVAVVLPLMKVKEPKKLIQKMQWCEYLINFFYKSLMSALDCIQVAPGPFSVYRKSIILKVGGFTNDKKNLTEDLEISLRLQKNDYRLIQLMDAEVYTLVPNTLKAFLNQRMRWYRGIIYNAVKYRKMVFNPKYGDFGLMQMPRILLSGILALTFLMVVSYNYMIEPILRRVYILSYVQFSIFPTWKNFISNFNIIDLNYTNVFFAVVIFTLSAIVILSSYKHTREPMLRYGIITIPAYLLMYSFIAATAWAGVIIGLIFRRKEEWWR